MAWVQRSVHFFRLFSLGIQNRIGKEAAVPFVQTEWRVCHNTLEQHQIIVFDVLRIAQGIALPDAGIVYLV